MLSLHTFLDTTSPQRISLARIGQGNEKTMVGGKVMSGKGEKKRVQCDTKRSRIAPV